MHILLKKKILGKIQNIFCNALVKYQTNNPFRRNANYNAPIPLLLNVLKEIKMMKKRKMELGFIGKITILICWPNNNYIELYNFIKDFRRKWGYRASDEVVYEKCLELLKQIIEKIQNESNNGRIG